MDRSLKVVILILSLIGFYYIATLLKDGMKLQKFRKRWYNIPYHSNKYSSYNESINLFKRKEKIHE